MTIITRLILAFPFLSNCRASPSIYQDIARMVLWVYDIYLMERPNNKQLGKLVNALLAQDRTTLKIERSQVSLALRYGLHAVH